MSGNSKGAKAAVKTIKAIYGEDHYVRAGRAGGRAGNTGGFYNDPERASITGRLGGRPKGPHQNCKCISCQYKKRKEGSR